MATQTEDYLALITPEHAGKPKLAATIGLSVDPHSRMQAALEALALDFDLDDAVGAQLDAVGVRIGRSRLVPLPLQGLFFTWGDPLRGWGSGVWKGKYEAGSSIYRLDDETYRKLLRAKVLANRWDGTLSMLEAIYDAYFDDPTTLVFCSDDSYSAQPRNFFTWGDAARGWGRGEWAPSSTSSLSAPSISTVDMKLTVGIAGHIPSPIDLAILDEGLVGAKPEGVTVQTAVTTVEGAPVFGFGCDNAYVSGWGVGAWAGTPASQLSGNQPFLAADDGSPILMDVGTPIGVSL